jgi:hypothetical protein
MPAVTKKAATKPDSDPDLVSADSGVETWRNATPGITFFTKLGEYGKRETELVYGGRTFALTPAERRLNQNMYATTELDLFTNGTFVPVALIDGEPDTPQLRKSPNTLTDSDIQKLLTVRGEAFAQRMNEITSDAVLTRVLEMAREPRYETTLAQYETIKMRQMALKGDLDETAPTSADPNGALPRAVTPR